MGLFKQYCRCEYLNLDHSERCSVDEEGEGVDNLDDDEGAVITNRENISNELITEATDNTITVHVTDYETGVKITELQIFY